MKSPWTKFCAGCYQHTAADGRFLELRSAAFETEGESSERAWVLHCWDTEGDQFGPSDSYCCHYPSLKFAKREALQMIQDCPLDAR